MATKAELADRIGVETGERPNPDSHTVAELQEMLLEATKPKDPQEAGNELMQALRDPGGVTRRKVNRGSTRRINRAVMNLQKALDDFADEIDVQVWITDGDGNRIDEVDLVKETKAFRKGLSGMVAEFTTPSLAKPAEEKA